MNTAASTHEFTLSPTMIGACLDDLIDALAERPGVPEDRRLRHASATRSLILSFRPRDGIQLVLAGQTVMFSALATDGARDVLRDMTEPLKSRARSSVTAMGRIVARHIDTLINLQGSVARDGETRAASTEQIPTVPPEASSVDAAPADARADEPNPVRTAEVEAPPKPGPAARAYPGREAMIASRSARLSRRKKTQLARKLMNVLRNPQAP
jgi:hypothetical protein